MRFSFPTISPILLLAVLSAIAVGQEVPGNAIPVQPKPNEELHSRGLQDAEEDRRDQSSADLWVGEQVSTSSSRNRSDSDSKPEPGPRRRFAICIGINQYGQNSGFSPLRYAATDATAMAKSFLNQAKFEKVLLMADDPAAQALQSPQHASALRIVSNVGRASLYEEIRKFVLAAKRSDDVLVFYFAGHGHSEREQAFLVPSDYDKDDPNPLYLSEVFNLVNGHRVFAANKLILLDACRSAVNDERGHVMVRSFHDALKQAGNRLFVLSGCDAEQSSHEDSALQHGRFTWALLDAMTGNGFRPGDEYLLVSHLYDHVLKTFGDRKWFGKQAPQQFASGSVFSLARRTIPKPKPFSKIQWDRFNRDRGDAQKLYREGALEAAAETFDYALRATGQRPSPDLATRQVQGDVMFEQALALYRLGQGEESRELRDEAVKLRSESSLLSTLEGCDFADAKNHEQAFVKFTAAIAAAGDPNDIDEYLWYRKAAVEEILGRYAAATLSYGKAALAAHRVENKRAATQHFTQMRQIDFKRAWLEQGRLTLNPEYGLAAATASYACACEIFGEKHWRSTEAKVLLDAVKLQAQLPPSQRRTILELETLYNRLEDAGRSAEAVSIIRLLNDYERELHGSTNAWCGNSFSIIGKRLVKLNQPAEAAEAFQQALTNYEAHYGAEHPNTVRTQIRLAAALKSADRKAEAAQLLERAKPGLEQLIRILDEEDDADSTWDLGHMLYYAGSYQAAIPVLETATSEYDALQKPIDAAWMAGWIGSCYRELKQDEQAAKFYESSVNRFREARHVEGIAIESDNLARALFRLQRYQEAISQFEAAAAEYAKSSPSDEAQMQDWIGDSLRKLKRARDAFPYYQRALATFEKLNQPADIAKVTYDLADTHYDIGDNARSAELFAQATSLSDSAKLPLKAGWSQAMQGLCEKKLNRDEQSLANFLGALDRFSKVQHKDDITAIYTQTAQMLRRLRRDEEALRYFDMAAESDAARGRTNYVAWAHVQRAGCLATLKRPDDVRAANLKVIEVLQSQPTRDGMGESLLGQALLALARHEEALSHFTAAGPAYEKEQNLVAAARMQEWRGDCFRDLKHDADAAVAYGEAVSRFEKIQHQEDLYYLRREYAKALFRSKRYGDAIPEFQATAAICEKQNQPVNASWMFAWLGDSCVALKRDAEAAQYYQTGLTRFSKLDHKEEITHVHRDFAKTLRRLNRLSEAIPEFEVAANSYEAQGKTLEAAWMRDWAGGCYRDLKQDEKAVVHYQSAFQVFLAAKDTAGIAEEGDDLGQALTRLNRRAEAITPLQAAAQAYDQLNKPLDAAWSRSWLGDCHRLTGEHEQAIVIYQASLATFQQQKSAAGIADDGSDLGKLLVRAKRFDEAAAALLAATLAYEELKKPDDAADTRLALIEAYRATAQIDLSLKHYDLLLARFASQGRTQRLAEIAEQCGRDLLQAKRPEDARRYLTEAEQAYRKLNNLSQADRVQRTLAEAPPGEFRPLLAP